jgi:hypothetical protein
MEKNDGKQVAEGDCNEVDQEEGCVNKVDCICCFGVGKVGEHSNSSTHKCQWCNGKWFTSLEVNQAFLRIFKETSNLFKMCKIFGNGKKVLETSKRKC